MKKHEVYLPSGRNVNLRSKAAPFALALPNLDYTMTECWPPKIEAAGVMVTNRCGAKCDHCFNNSSPEGQESLEVGTVLRFVKILIESKHPLKVVGISGGEPFMYDDLPRLIQEMKGINVPVTITTGGTGLTDEKLKLVLDAGLDGLVLSMDDFHAPFVSRDTLLKRITTAVNFGVDVKVSLGIRHMENEFLEELDMLLPLEVPIEVHPVFNVGRASGILDSSEEVCDICDTGSCAQEFNSISLNYDGFIYPCCSVGGFFSELQVAHVDEILNGADLTKAYEERHLLKKLHDVGWTSDDGSRNSMNKCVSCRSLARAV